MLGDLETLKDWCAPKSYSLFEHQLTEFKEAGYRNESRIMDLRNADVSWA
jgi:predicted lipid-binding transport protein (Tim44 family)